MDQLRDQKVCNVSAARNGKHSDKHQRSYRKPMNAPQMPGPRVHSLFELQQDQVSRANTETYRANVEHRKGGPHMFDSMERSGPAEPALRRSTRS